MKIHLTETSAWTGNLLELMIDSGVLTFSGSDIYAERFPETLPLRPETFEQLDGALTMLEVFDWRDAYRPEDVGSTVDDGGSWSIDVSNHGRSISSKGNNAWPSYKSPDVTAIHQERYGLLRAAVFAALHFSVPFGFQPNKQEAESGPRE